MHACCRERWAGTFQVAEVVEGGPQMSSSPVATTLPSQQRGARATSVMVPENAGALCGYGICPQGDMMRNPTRDNFSPYQAPPQSKHTRSANASLFPPPTWTPASCSTQQTGPVPGGRQGPGDTQ